MGTAGKRLLILGAGRGQVGLYKAAKELGITTIAGTMQGDNLPCLPLADEICYMDISKPEDALETVKNIQFDGVATCCLDTGVPTLGKICDQFSLTGLTEKAAVMCGDKLKMKQAFMEHGVSTAKFYKICNEEDLSAALEKLSLPVIIKATDLQGSNGIYISNTKEEAISGFINAMKKTKRDYCIIEEFIEGWEFGAQAFVYNNEVIFVMPHGDETYMSHTAVPVGHYVPLDVSDNIYKQTEITVKNAIKALGLNNCAVNVDLIMKDNTVYVIELTGRIGANCLPELVQIHYGIEYYKMVAVMAVGENPLVFWNERRHNIKAGLSKMILETEKYGVLDSIEYSGLISGDVLEVTFFKNPGDEIRAFENSNDCIGQIIVQGITIDGCQNKLNEVMAKIEMKLK